MTEALLPISTRTAHQIGLIDDAFEEDAASFRHHIRELAEELASSYRYEHLLEEKRHTRKTDEASKPLQAYREEELQRMWLNFFCNRAARVLLLTLRATGIGSRK